MLFNLHIYELRATYNVFICLFILNKALFKQNNTKATIIGDVLCYNGIIEQNKIILLTFIIYIHSFPLFSKMKLNSNGN